jgi:hypothetical protein
MHKYTNARCLQNVEECTVMLYGSVMRPMIKLGIWPPSTRQSVDILNSVNDFSAPLSGIRIYCHKNHYSCNLFGNEIRDGVIAIFRNIPIPLLESHRQHFKQHDFKQNDQQIGQKTEYKKWCA